MVGNAWRETTIGDEATLQRGIDITKAEQRAGKVPVVSSGGVSSYHDTAAVKGPGVVLGRKGVVGSVFFVEEDYWPHDTSLWVKDFHGNFPRFVYYFFRSVAPQLARMDVGSANPTLNRNHVHPIPIVWPPLAEQEAIATILGALDDKIELNRRMNATLESMARALFQSWFVDFDPVRAKLDGQEPTGLDPEIVALFPESFQDSILGLIPKGWAAKPLGALCSLGRGASPRPINDFMNGDIPWIKIADATGAGGPFLFETKERVTRTGAEKSVPVAPGDLILSNSATCGVPIFVELHGCIHDGWLYFKDLQFISKLYLFHVLIELASHLVHIADGSVQKNLNTSLVGQQIVLVPPAAVIAAFDSHVGVWFKKMRQNALESRTLSALRDSLLPKLLSGEIRLGAASEMLEAAL